MAIYEKVFTGDFHQTLSKIENHILSTSSTASLENSSDFVTADARCSVRVFERYSYTGSNRLSLSVTLFESNGLLHLSAAASGGSQGMIFKLNTFGEEAFLNKLKEII